MRFDATDFDDCGDLIVTRELADKHGLTAQDIQRLLGPVDWQDLERAEGAPVLLGAVDEVVGSDCVRCEEDHKGFPVFIVDIAHTGFGPRAVVVNVLGVGRGAPYVGMVPEGH